jgi:bifunctional non-homologous end joining protein LigD
MSFNQLQRRGRVDVLAIKKHAIECPMTFVAFDVLWTDGQDVRSRPLSERRAILERIVQDRDLVRVAQQRKDIVALFGEVMAADGEGVVVKRASAPYVSARVDSWIKVKSPGRRVDNLLVVGVTVGTGKRASTFGSFVLAQRREDGSLAYFGPAGSGLKDAELERVTNAFASHKVVAPIVEIRRLRKPILHYLDGRILADVVIEKPVKDDEQDEEPKGRHPRVRSVKFPPRE